MTHDQAVKIAVEALRYYRRKYIFDANMVRFYGSDNPHALNCDQKVKEIDQAIEVLTGNPKLKT